VLTVKVVFFVLDWSRFSFSMVLKVQLRYDETSLFEVFLLLFLVVASMLIFLSVQGEFLRLEIPFYNAAFSSFNRALFPYFGGLC